MKKLEQEVVDWLESTGNPQTMQAIADHLTAMGYKTFDWYTIDAIREEGGIKHWDGGVDSRGEPIKLYAPNSFHGE